MTGSPPRDLSERESFYLFVMLVVVLDLFDCAEFVVLLVDSEHVVRVGLAEAVVDRVDNYVPIAQ